MSLATPATEKGVRCHGDACCAGQLPCPTPEACKVESAEAITAPLLANLVATTATRSNQPTNRAPGGKPLKYVRTVHGFTVFPSMAAVHLDLSRALAGRPISAGFVEWDVGGRPLCMGESDSLGIKSRDDDTAALRADWGMSAPAPFQTTSA